MPNDFAMRGVARARDVLANAPAEDEYGFTYQTDVQGIHGSHRSATPMTTTTEPTTRDVEHRTGVESLEWLQTMRRKTVEEAAPLRARRDVFDAERKSRRGVILARINAARLANGEKELPATLAETHASADAEYVDYLADARVAFAKLAILEDTITAYTERIRSRQSELYAYGAEARLGG